MKQSLLPILSVLLFACGVNNRVKPDPTVLDMEPVIVRPSSPDRPLDFYTAQDLFNRGRLARSFEKFEDCVRFFTMTIDDFPKSRYALPALYNRGLCHESLSDPNSAIESFEQYTQLTQDPVDRLDGFFRLLHNLVDAERNTRALVLAERLLEIELTDLDQAEIIIKKGIVLGRLAKKKKSKALLLKAARIATEATDGLVHGNAVLAEAEYELGVLYLNQMSAVRLVLPLDRMKLDLGKKMTAFRKSQRHLLNAITGQVKEPSTKAGEALGNLYATLYGDLLAAERPADLSPVEVQIYLEELIKRVTPVLKNAITIYEKSIALGQRLGADKRWLSDVNIQKERLESLLKETHDAPKEK